MVRRSRRCEPTVENGNKETDSSKLAIAGFFGCFVISEILIGWIDRLFGRKKVFEPHIVRRLKREPEDS
ncbi:SoxR reducing system RseC family protein [bacterium]|nr:SoxR reducing system RseC family protein [bacterium]